MAKTALDIIKDKESFLSLYTQGMSLLYQSGIFEFLRENGRGVPVSPEVPNYVEYQLAIYNRCLGYQAALDDLYYFQEKFLTTLPSLQNVDMDFGGVDEALKKGDLTKEDLDAIRK